MAWGSQRTYFIRANYLCCADSPARLPRESLAAGQLSPAVKPALFEVFHHSLVHPPLQQRQLKGGEEREGEGEREGERKREKEQSERETEGERHGGEKRNW